MSYESVHWQGDSGFEYLFHVHRRGEDVPSRQGVYIYAKQNPEGTWFPVYMGDGDLSVCCDDEALSACIDEKGATHIHMRLCPISEGRADELADLLKRYKNAYVPDGCNVGPAEELAAAGEASAA